MRYWNIIANLPTGREIVDTADDYDTARYLQGEYRLAFGIFAIDIERVLA